MTQPPRQARNVACPTCGGKALFAPANPHRPFCSERCRVRDLGAWAAESYRIPAKTETNDPEAPSREPEG